MDKLFKHISPAFHLLASIVAFSSCTSEAPFSTDGEGLVKMNVVVNARTTRSVLDSEYGDYLKENCRIYISNEKGVLHKWVGVDKVPEKGVALRYGSYVAEGFAGDSVAASFDKVYFKGVAEFAVSKEVSVTQVSLKCNIANVVASVDSDALSDVGVSDLKVVVANSLGKLEFSGDDLFNKGYYMMPQGDTSLTYSVTGKDIEGKDFSKEGEISGVLPAHEYHLKLKYDPDGIANGGALIKIAIEEESLVEEKFEFFGKPSFAWVGYDDDIEGQIIVTEEPVVSHTFRAAAYGFSSLTFSSANEAIISAFGGVNRMDLCMLSETGKKDLGSKGIEVSDVEKDGLYKYFVKFTPDFFNALPIYDKEYVIDVVAKDVSGKENSAQIRIANTEDAIVFKSPVRIDPSYLDSENYPMAVLATSATIPVIFTKEDVENPSVQYRERGESSWLTEPVEVTRANYEGTANLKNLKRGTTYECRAVAGSVNGDEYEFASDIVMFTTESMFIIPNASMEEWSTYGKSITFPGSGSERTFWDSGNEGAAKASDVLTTPCTDIFHSGATCAKLETKFASVVGIGKLAAGNLFVGKYEKTDVTDGVLTFGRPYDGSHPSKLSAWVKYAPASITDRKTSNLDRKEKDLGQIFIALSTEPVEIRTKKSSKLFNKDDACILAYGEKTFEDDYDDNGNLKQVEIPLDYKESAKSKKSLYLIIVCTASKYGDYFEGGRGSTMYVDDFELVYE